MRAPGADGAGRDSTGEVIVMKQPPYQRLLLVLLAFFGVIVIGMAGYTVITHCSPFDALYMTIITIASVGYAEIVPHSYPMRLFTMFLIVVGSSVVVYTISVFTAYIVEGELSDILRRRKMQRAIEKLHGHYIICGAGQTGQCVIDELLLTKHPFLVIERDPEIIKSLLERNILHIEGDARRDGVLRAAGIDRAVGLTATLDSDADNLFVIFTARQLHAGLRIISRANDSESEAKLRLAGANAVVSPINIGGLRIASELIRPSVTTFLDLMLRSKDRVLRVDEIDIKEGSPFVGKTLDATGFLHEEGVSVVAMAHRAETDYIFNPPKSTHLTADSVLIVMGNVEHITRMREKAAPHAGQENA